MVPEDLLFWIAPLVGTPHDEQNVLCLRHADALTVPRGWTLDDRREEFPRLFRPGTPQSGEAAARPNGRSPRRRREPVEQLVIDGTGEIERPVAVVDAPMDAPSSSEQQLDEAADGEAEAETWTPTFDHDSDLDGLLETDSPLLARAFRGTGRRRD